MRVSQCGLRMRAIGVAPTINLQIGADPNFFQVTSGGYKQSILYNAMHNAGRQLMVPILLAHGIHPSSLLSTHHWLCMIIYQ